MNFVYLSPHFPSNYESFCIQLRRLGVNVLGIADAPYEALSPRLREVLNEYYRIEDMHSYDQLLRACGYFTHRHGKIDRIESHAEYWLETEARLRTDFNIPGLRHDQIAWIKQKSLMKERFRKARVRVARGAVVHTLEEARELVRKTGYPVVAKPDIGVGAASTYKLRGPDDLAHFFREKPQQDYILEEFIDGELMSFDGLTNREGELVFCASHVFSQGIMETVTRDDHIYYYSVREIPPDLEEAGRRVLKAFEVRERFFHFEFFRARKDGGLVALEVNMRPPGGLTTDMFNYSNDIDIYREWANVVVNNRFDASYSRPYHCCYVGRKSHRHYIHDLPEILDRFGYCICHHEAIHSIFRAAIGDYGYLVRSPDLDEVRRVAAFILEEHVPVA